MKKDAFVWWDGGVCHVIDCKTRTTPAKSTDFRRATRRARNLCYDVRVYKGDYAQAPRDAVSVALGSYVLPAARKQS